jgi:hypothetical protein
MVFSCVALAPSSAHAGAWTRDQESFYLQVGYAYSYATGNYKQSGLQYDWQNPAPVTINGVTSKVPPLRNAHQTDNSFIFYSEYGILDFLTAIVTWEAKVVDKDLGPDAIPAVATGHASGIPEVRVGLRGRVLKAPFVLSLEMLVGIPAQAPRLEPINFDPQVAVPIGLGAYNATTQVHLGKSWSEYFSGSLAKYLSLYTNFALGYQYRDNFLSNFVFNLELGAIVASHVFVGARYYGDKNLGERVISYGNPLGGSQKVTAGENEQQRWAVTLGYVWDKYIFATVDYSAPTGGANSLLFQRIGVSVATSF